MTISEPLQLGDATVLKIRICGIASADTITIHRVRKQAIGLDLASKDDVVRSAVPVEALPELIRTFIARSGRTDLHLVVDEPTDDSEGSAFESDTA